VLLSILDGSLVLPFVDKTADGLTAVVVVVLVASTVG
jgi:hypothetical protein